MTVPPRHPRGVALVQALVLAAALAGVAAVLLLRTQGALERMQARDGGLALVAALDAGQTQLVAILAALPPDAPVGLDEAWAQPREGVEVGEARLSWQMRDLDGRFDLMRLAGDDEEAFAAFVRLAESFGLGRSEAEQLAARLRLTLDPLAPSVLFPDTLLPPAADQRFLEAVAVLDGSGALNVNSAPLEVLAAFLPELSPSAFPRIDQRRRERPFVDAEDLMDWAGTALGEDAALSLDEAGLSTQSIWFAFDLRASLDSRVLRRSGVMRRYPTGGAPQIHYAVTHP